MSIVLRLLVLGSAEWGDPAPIRSLLEVASPDAMLHPATAGAALMADAVASELSIAREPLPAEPGESKRSYRLRLLSEVGPTVAAVFAVGRAGARSSDLDGGLGWAVRRTPIIGREDGVCLPVVVYREDGIEGPPIKAKSPKAADVVYARDELRRLWVALPQARPVIATAGAAVAAAMSQASLGPGFGGELDASITAAWSAVEALRIAEPRLSPWLVVSERLLRKWAPI